MALIVCVKRRVCRLRHKDHALPPAQARQMHKLLPYTTFLLRALEATIVLMEGLLLPLEVFLLLLFKSTPLAYTNDQSTVHHFPLESSQVISGGGKQSESYMKSRAPESTMSALPLLRRAMTWEEKFAQYVTDIGSPTRSMWSDPSAAAVLVRGPTYLNDSIKIRTGPSFGKLVHVDVWKATAARPGRIDHIAELDLARPISILRYFQQEHTADTVFVLNFQVPGTPFVHVVCYWLVSATDIARHRPFALLWTQFRAAIDANTPAFCNDRFKLIPALVAAPWLVKVTVPQKPALVGKKLTQRYHSGRNYIEVDMDIPSSTIAANVVGLCRGYATQVDVDLHVTLQGDSPAELPENIFASVRFSKLDFAHAQDVPTY
ncbi:hypothetical protein DYB35_001944 [Aphanomyces astaci]|uniref:Protein ENHANCED DISEASE RESISTANCE 2 C-terminal domain-containing protein n=2 Tax=Aphanomyces astaci TaxID=112090 RepID=A0A3R7A799_APHAT|nr:hypothetical protein DYB35_001944 [Aphanomyces astaci]